VTVGVNRLHIVGTSKDNKRLLLARAKDAKFGSFEVPIGPKLLKLLREAEEARRPARKRTPREADEATSASAEKGGGEKADGPAKRATPARPAAREGGGAAARADVDARPQDRRQKTQTQRPSAKATKKKASGEVKDGVTKRGKRAGGKDATAEDAPATPAPPARDLIRPRVKRPKIPARSKLKPAEIQSMIRAGRTVRSVARIAGTPAEWVQWLAEPIQQERQSVVEQMLRQRQGRARLGASAEPLGVAVALNLRSRGVSGADRVVEEGFSAARSNGRKPWRVRLSFEHRGHRQSAVWGFDPGSREVTPLNTLATQLGWRRPRSKDASGDAAEDGAAPARRRRSSG